MWSRDTDKSSVKELRIMKIVHHTNTMDRGEITSISPQKFSMQANANKHCKQMH